MRRVDGLSRRVLAAYAAPAFSQSLIHGPAISVLQGIYAKHFGLGLEQIALVLFVSRIFDAANDPVIGYLSDRYRSRHGSRKPWLIVGSLVAVVACWFLYVPVAPVTTFSFLLWYLLADIGWTISEVPYSAWMAELSEDYDERTRIANWRSVCRILGLMAFFGMPVALAPFFGTSEFTPETLRWSAILATIALPTTALLAAAVVPDGTAPGPPSRNALGEATRAVGRNRPLWNFTAMFAIQGLGGGMGWGLVFFYVDGYLGLGEKFAGVLMFSIPVCILATPVWASLCRRFGKQQAWAAGCVGAAFASLGYVVIAPGHSAAVWLTITLLLINALVVVEGVAGPAVLADVVDYGRWRFGADHGGIYFAFYSMVQKINVGIGAALGLWVAATLGFDAKLRTQTSAGRFGLLFAFSVLPALSYLVSAVMIWRFPINQRRQRAIVRALDRRQDRLRRSDVQVPLEMSPR